jgi:RNA polymerase primary sigma factor
MSTMYQTSSVVSRKIGGTPAADPLPTAGHDATIDFLLANASRVPLLSAEEERSLSERVQAGDEAAKRLFIEANLRLAAHVAKDYADTGLPFEDLLQEGCLGLMNAVSKYDPEQGRFSTYACWWIKQSMLRAVGNTVRTIRLPIYVHGLLRQIERATNTLYEEQGSEPRVEQVARETGLTPERIVHLSSMDQRPVSLQRPIAGTNEAILADTIPDTTSPTIDEAVMEQSHHEALPALIEQALQGLTSRERQVLILCFGLDGHGSRRELAEVGRMIGVTRERVRQLEQRALAKLRQPEYAPLLHAFITDLFPQGKS